MSKRNPIKAAYRLPMLADRGKPRAGIRTDLADPDLIELITALAREAARRDHLKALAALSKADEK